MARRTTNNKARKARYYKYGNSRANSRTYDGALRECPNCLLSTPGRFHKSIEAKTSQGNAWKSKPLCPLCANVFLAQTRQLISPLQRNYRVCVLKGSARDDWKYCDAQVGSQHYMRVQGEDPSAIPDDVTQLARLPEEYLQEVELRKALFGERGLMGAGDDELDIVANEYDDNGNLVAPLDFSGEELGVGEEL